MENKNQNKININIVKIPVVGTYGGITSQSHK